MGVKLYEQTAEQGIKFTSNRRIGDVRVPNYVYDMWMPLLGSDAIGVYSVYCRLERSDVVKGMTLRRLAKMCRIGGEKLNKINDSLSKCGFITIKKPKGHKRLMHWTTEITVLDPPQEVPQEIIEEYQPPSGYEPLCPWLVTEGTETPNGATGDAEQRDDAAPNGAPKVASLSLHPSEVVIAAKAASETPTAHASDGPMEADISDSTITFQCPNPECEKEIHPGALKKSATRCPHCEQPLLVLVNGDQYGKPPKAKPDPRKNRTLGNLLDDCPTPLKLFPYFAGDRKEILAAWCGENQGVLRQALQWCLTKYLKDGMPHHVCVRNAMAFFRRKVSAMSGSVHVEEEDDGGGSWIGDDIFNDPEGSDVAQTTDGRRARVLVR